MKEMFLVGLAAGIGGLILGKWGAPIEARVVAMGIPPQVEHFGLVAGAAMAVFYVGRRVL